MTNRPSHRWPTESDLLTAWREGDGEGVKVAVLDSGVETSHSALAGRVLEDDLNFQCAPDESVIIGSGNGEDSYGHGTAIAWLIWSIAPRAKVGSFRIMGHGRLSSKRELVKAAAHEVVKRGYHVMNCSFGHRAAALYSLDYKEWVEAAYVAGCSVVAACDNAGSTQEVFPAHFASVIGVDRTDRAESTEVLWRKGRLVEFAALGENVRVPWKDETWKTVIGSSYAAPRVAGLVARLLSKLPHLSAAQMKAALQAMAGVDGE